VKVEGLRDLKRDLKRLAGDAADLKAANAAASAMVAAAARGSAPRATGRLAGTVKGTATVAGVSVRVAAPYAGVVHYGWPARGVPARPFVIDAAQRTEPAWLALYLADLDRAVAKLAGRTY
jgi:hypothetical protein